MPLNSNSHRGGATACIHALIALQTVMLFSLFTKTAPHPPLTVPLFALAPFLGMSIALGVLAATLISHGLRPGYAAAILFAIASLVSFGPQKLLADELALIWPAVMFGMASSLALIYLSAGALRGNVSRCDGASADGMHEADGLGSR